MHKASFLENKFPFSITYDNTTSYVALTEQVKLTPTVDPNSEVYSYKLLSSIPSLTINPETGVIAGYINNNTTKTMKIEIKGERTLIYELELNIISKQKCTLRS